MSAWSHAPNLLIGRDKMDEETVFAWEVAQMMGISNSKFLRTCADDLPCQKKGGVRLYLRSDVEGYLYPKSAAKKRDWTNLITETKLKEKDNEK